MISLARARSESLSPEDDRLRVTYVITTLEAAGAENMLLRLATRLAREGHVISVVSLGALGPIGEQLRSHGIEVVALDMPSARLTPRGLVRLARHLRSARPHVVHTWMYHADLVGGLTARLVTRARVVWSIRGSIEPDHSAWHQMAVVRVCALLSRWVPHLIISCSRRLVDLHGELGYAMDRAIVIPNGFDLHAFRPDPAAAEEVRRELGIPEKALVVGHVARSHPQKDHASLLRAAELLVQDVPDVVFALCGDGVDHRNPALQSAIPAALHDRVLLLGRRDDLARLNCAFDVAVSSSAFGEGFSNAIGEAMACAVPCVVTDVGDSAFLVGAAGRSCPPSDPEALTAALLSILRLPSTEREKLGADARNRMEEHFEADDVSRRFTTAYRELR